MVTRVKWIIILVMRKSIEVPFDRLKEFCRKWKIAELSFFGSVLREDFGPDSDIDVLVSFSPEAKWTLFDFVDMRDELKEILGRDVDLVSKAGLRNPFRRHEILNSREIVYAA